MKKQSCSYIYIYIYIYIRYRERERDRQTDRKFSCRHVLFKNVRQGFSFRFIISFSFLVNKMLEL